LSKNSFHCSSFLPGMCSIPTALVSFFILCFVLVLDLLSTMGITPTRKFLWGVLVWIGILYYIHQRSKILEKKFFCSCEKYVIILEGGWAERKNYIFFVYIDNKKYLFIINVFYIPLYKLHML
jgi:hypothetical protein